MAADRRPAMSAGPTARRERLERRMAVGIVGGIVVLLSGLTLFGPASLGQSKNLASRQADYRAEDAQLKRRIAGRMLDARAVFFADIGIDTVAGDVLLTGRVKARQDKTRAAALVRSVLGVNTVVNEIRVGGKGDIKTLSNDLDIEKRIGRALRKVFRRRMPRIAWRANNGVVYVFGRAKSEWEHNKALAVIRKTSDIEDIVDHLRIVKN